MTNQRKNAGGSQRGPADRPQKPNRRAGNGRRRKKSAKQTACRPLRILLTLLVCMTAALLTAAAAVYCLGSARYKERLSDRVLDYRPDVEAAAEEYGISEYVPCLLAIMQVESKGKGEDVMQASESMGLSPNTLTAEESILQGCRYFAELLRRAETLGCDTDSVIQAYNYGIGYLDYVAVENGVHTPALAVEYARGRSGGRRQPYFHPIAIRANGGWKYRYGNMFYVQLVKRYLP